MFAKNLNTFLGVYQNARISSYVENIFMKTPNEKFGVLVNIFSTYDEIRAFCFCSKKEHNLKFLSQSANLIKSRIFLKILSRIFKKIINFRINCRKAPISELIQIFSKQIFFRVT